MRAREERVMETWSARRGEWERGVSWQVSQAERVMESEVRGRRAGARVIFWDGLQGGGGRGTVLSGKR